MPAYIPKRIVWRAGRSHMANSATRVQHAGSGCAYSELEMMDVFSADRIGYLLAETQYEEQSIS